MQLLLHRILPGVCFVVFLFVISVTAQKVAILSPDGSEASRAFAERLEDLLVSNFRIVDSSMSESAFASISADNKLNMTADESKAAGSAIGCDYFILIKADTLRRSSSKRAKYFESYAAVYAVSSRTGRLVFWGLPRLEGETLRDSQMLLDASAAPLAVEIVSRLRAAAKSELAEQPVTKMESPPDPFTSPDRSFRAPIPYRRIKPEYTADAYLYSITATIDIVVDLDERGSVLRTEIVRWAGYGLDESVEKAVRSMNWRPAERGGKPLPMRFLLRYNFKKPDKE